MLDFDLGVDLKAHRPPVVERDGVPNDSAYRPAHCLGLSPGPCSCTSSDMGGGRFGVPDDSAIGPAFVMHTPDPDRPSPCCPRVMPRLGS